MSATDARSAATHNAWLGFSANPSLTLSSVAASEMDFRVESDALRHDDPTALVWAVIEPAYFAVSLPDDPNEFAAATQPLTTGQRALLAMYRCITEVSNGGFDQFFLNAGAFAPDTIEGMRRLDAAESAGLVVQATTIFAERPPPADVGDPAFDEADDADVFDAYLERFSPLEDRFYALVDSELYPKAAEYVRRHREQFVR